jgi:hypothetical protein
MIAITAGLDASNVLPRNRSGGVRGRSRVCSSGRLTAPSCHPQFGPGATALDRYLAEATAGSAERPPTT